MNATSKQNAQQYKGKHCKLIDNISADAAKAFRCFLLLKQKSVYHDCNVKGKTKQSKKIETAKHAHFD